jgi:phage tail sheath protein FI
MPSTVVVQDSTDTTTYVLGTHYTFALNAAGEGTITRVSTGTITAGATLHVAYSYLKPTEVLAADIVGTVDASTQLKTGLELVAEVFPRFRMVPGQVLAPGFSTDATVKSAMVAKASNINGNFRALALADIPTASVAVYSAAAAWKSTNGYTDVDLVTFWPMGRLGDTLYHLSTLTAARAMQTDADNDGIPYESPSNKNIPIDSLALSNGTEVVLDTVAAASLNSQGIVTALNFIGGWKLWGNRTAVYPGNTDPADAFIPLARMRAWNTGVIVLSHWQRVDNPMNRRKIEAVVDTENIRMNALAARGFIIGARVEFREEDNPVTGLLDGQAVYAVSWMPPPPMDGITFNVEVDPSYLASLFA